MPALQSTRSPLDFLRLQATPFSDPMQSSLRNIARWFVLPVLAVALLLAPQGCGRGSEEESTITVFAAASLTDAFREIAREFEGMNPGTKVRLNFAGSQRLRSQLELGAAGDIFASADEVQMGLARDEGLLSGSGEIFASATMAVIASGKSELMTLEDMSAPGIKVVLAHENVPAGKYSRELLQLLSDNDSELGTDYAGKVLSNVVSDEPSVKFVEQKVVLGQADVGIVYRPGMLTALANTGVRELPLPASTSEVKAKFPIAILADSGNPGTAERFLDFVLSQTSRRVLAKHGFGPP